MVSSQPNNESQTAVQIMNQKKRRFRFKAELSIGDLLTAGSIIIASVAVFAAWSKDRDLRRHENAEKIRHSAGIVIAKMERWKERSHSFYNDLLPLFADTAASVTKHRDRNAAHSLMYKGIVVAHAESTSRIINEEIEIAYADLYGYDPGIRDLFVKTISRLKEIDCTTLDNLYDGAVQDLDDFLYNQKREKDKDPLAVNNNLRLTCLNFDKELQDKMEEVIAPVRDSVSKFIRMSDEEINGGRDNIPSPQNVFGNMPKVKECLGAK